MENKCENNSAGVFLATREIITAFYLMQTARLKSKWKLKLNRDSNRHTNLLIFKLTWFHFPQCDGVGHISVEDGCSCSLAAIPSAAQLSLHHLLSVPFWPVSSCAESDSHFRVERPGLNPFRLCFLICGNIFNYNPIYWWLVLVHGMLRLSSMSRNYHVPTAVVTVQHKNFGKRFWRAQRKNAVDGINFY